MKATLTALSVCPCGFSLLNDAIPLGKVYDIDPNDREDVTLTCGGCGKEHHLTAVQAAPGGYIPEQVFSLIV